MNFEGQVTSSHGHTLLSQNLHILLVHTAEKEKVLCCMKTEFIANTVLYITTWLGRSQHNEVFMQLLAISRGDIILQKTEGDHCKYRKKKSTRHLKSTTNTPDCLY